MVLLPVPARDRALHAGAVGEDGVQLPVDLRGRHGRLHRLRLHAAAHHGHPALLRGRPMTPTSPSPRLLVPEVDRLGPRGGGASLVLLFLNLIQCQRSTLWTSC